MKKISFLSMAIVIAFSCNQKKQETPKNADVLADNLNGKVEQTTETDYKSDSTGKVGEQDSCCVAHVNYDEKGYVTGYTNDNKAGTQKEEGHFVHYDNGAMKSVNNTKNNKPISTISIQIDKDGNYSGAQETDSSGKMNFYYTNLKQNDYGQLTYFKRYKADSSLSSTMTSTYDKHLFKGNEMKDSAGKVSYSSSVKLDNKNNVSGKDEKTVTKDSTINKVTSYKYDSFDDKGNWTQRTEMDKNGKPVKITKREITYYKD